MKNKELVRKIAVTLIIVIIVEFGKKITLPGIDIDKLTTGVSQHFFLYVLSFSTGGNLTVPTVFSLGLAPYMTALMVWQVVPMVGQTIVKQMSQQQKGMVQRILTLVFASLQAIVSMQQITKYYLATNQVELYLLILANFIIVIGGAMFVTWLADYNRQYGVGGQSALIVPGILLSLPNILKNSNGGLIQFSIINTVILVVLTVICIYITVLLNNAELRVPIQRTNIDNDFSDSYLPIKAMPASTMPFIFALSIFSLPQYLLTSQTNSTSSLGNIISTYFSFQTWRGVVVYAAIIIFLGYAFAFANVRPDDIAKDLQESGDYIYNVQPGLATIRYLRYRLLLMASLGGLHLGLVSILPLVIGLKLSMVTNLSFYFGSLVILITVINNVVIEVRSIKMRNQYIIFDEL